MRDDESKTFNSPEIESDKVYLTEAEMRVLEVGDRDSKIRKLERRLLERQGQIVQLEIELRQEKLKNMGYKLMDLDRVDSDKSNSHKTRTDEIKSRYDIEEDARWGYDPESGEIVVQRKES